MFLNPEIASLLARAKSGGGAAAAVSHTIFKYEHPWKAVGTSARLTSADIESATATATFNSTGTADFKLEGTRFNGPTASLGASYDFATGAVSLGAGIELTAPLGDLEVCGFFPVGEVVLGLELDGSVGFGGTGPVTVQSGLKGYVSLDAVGLPPLKFTVLQVPEK
jgi:hypothetical protein